MAKPAKKTKTKATKTKNSGTVNLDRMKRDLISKGVKYCLASYVDVHGVPKSKTVPIAHFDRMMGGSELFTGAALDGLGQQPSDDELAAHPDPNAVCILPWRREIAWAPGNLKYHDEPWPMCSRTVLSQQIERAAKMGFQFNLGIECEFYLVRHREDGGIEPPYPTDTLAKAAYDTLTTLESLDYLDEITSHMNELGWDVYSLDHEDSNGQFEIDFRYSDVLTTADRYVLWRLMAKELARKRGIDVAIMPKPYANRTGSGAHFNMSLTSLKTGENLMGSRTDKRGLGLSKYTYQFIAGILRHAPAIVATTCPLVNSYKRLIKQGSMTGFTWAPIFVSYGANNRTHMLRIPSIKPTAEDKKGDTNTSMALTRLECRVVDPAVNPYLGAAMLLAAGLEGIENDLDPGDPIEGNMYLKSDAELKELGVGTLPRTLLEGIDEFAADSLGKTVMGEDLFKSFIELKQAEWWEYHNTISPWELKTYFERF